MYIKLNNSIKYNMFIVSASSRLKIRNKSNTVGQRQRCRQVMQCVLQDTQHDRSSSVSVVCVLIISCFSRSHLEFDVHAADAQLVIIEGAGGHMQPLAMIQLIDAWRPIGAIANARVLLIGAQQSERRVPQLQHAKVFVHARGQDQIAAPWMRLEPPNAAVQIQFGQTALHGARIEQTQQLVVAAGEQLMLPLRMAEQAGDAGAMRPICPDALWLLRAAAAQIVGVQQAVVAAAVDALRRPAIVGARPRLKAVRLPGAQLAQLSLRRVLQLMDMALRVGDEQLQASAVGSTPPVEGQRQRLCWLRILWQRQLGATLQLLIRVQLVDLQLAQGVDCGQQRSGVVAPGGQPLHVQYGSRFDALQPFQGARMPCERIQIDATLARRILLALHQLICAAGKVIRMPFILDAPFDRIRRVFGVHAVQRLEHVGCNIEQQPKNPAKRNECAHSGHTVFNS